MITHKLLNGDNDPARRGSYTIKSALQSAREHLGMDIAYVSEFVGEKSIFRHVDAACDNSSIRVDQLQSANNSYCRLITDGRLPQLIPDTQQEPLAAALEITVLAKIGCHLSVPITLPNGEVYGMFSCLSHTPYHDLTERDFQVLRAFANMATDQISRDFQSRQQLIRKRARIRNIIDEQAFSHLFQPIWNLNENRVTGFECLTRFSAQPARTPDVWFNEAAEVNMGIELEVAAIVAALPTSVKLSESGYVSLNASPEAIMSTGFFDALGHTDMGRIVLEVTEHARVDDYGALMQKLAPYRERGLRLAVDDAGAGFASLKHIVQLHPDIIKLDMSLTRNIDNDPALRAMASALIFFARETQAHIVAEGIETHSELDTLRTLGVDSGQGYLLGRPQTVKSGLALMQPMHLATQLNNVTPIQATAI